MTSKRDLSEGQKSYSKTKSIRVEEFGTLKQWWQNQEEHEQAWKVNITTIAANGYNLDIKNPHIAAEEHQYSSAELLEMLHVSFRKSDELLAKLREELLEQC